MPAAQLLFLVSTAIVGGLGALHIAFTFHGDRLEPRDTALRLAMQAAHPVITRQTTVWRATRGFNASHGLGMLAFGLVYGHLAGWRPDVLAGSAFLLSLGQAVLLSYLVLARRYFFSVPFRAMALASALYAAGWALA